MTKISVECAVVLVTCRSSTSKIQRKERLWSKNVTSMKTVKQRNMVNREIKLAIGDELQSLFHPIAKATKQTTEETRKELAPMEKTLTDIDGALNRNTDARPQQRSRSSDLTFDIYRRQHEQLQRGIKEYRSLEMERLY